MKPRDVTMLENSFGFDCTWRQDLRCTRCLCNTWCVYITVYGQRKHNKLLVIYVSISDKW